ncbi:MAG: hypothetical protein AAGF47_10815 [Planctomycetota bacterium]
MRTAALVSCLAAAAVAGFAGCSSDPEVTDREAAALLGVEADASLPPAAGVEQVVFINDTCPIGQVPIEASLGGVSHKGHTVGFCCGGCKSMWSGMAEGERDAFVAGALAAPDTPAGG